MESEGGGVATAITPRRLSSQHSTLRESFLASDLAELNNTGIINTNAHYVVNHTSNDNSENSTSNPSNQRPVSTLTLGAVLNCDKKSPPPSNIVVRTLLEIIRNDETLNSGSSPRSQLASRKSWKSFKDRLKLRRASIAHSSNANLNQDPNSQSSVSAATTVVAMNAGNSLRQVDIVPSDDLALREVDSGGSPRSGGSFRLSAALAAEREETRRRLSRELIEANGVEEEEVVSSRERNEEGEERNNLGSQENQPVRMSLMDLLEETDRQAGVSGLLYSLDDDDDDEVAEEEEDKPKVEDEVEECSDGKVEHSCCVCMVRHKGAAFIPCGHTFCRLCSRELWVQRGNCPLCNNFILEVLDIF